MIRITLPTKFSFRHKDVYDFEFALSLFNWDIPENSRVTIDFSKCVRANYQALALVMLFVWHLRSKGCYIEFLFDQRHRGASEMWHLMGAKGWAQVATSSRVNFKSNKFKPLIAIRSHSDFEFALSKIRTYTSGFDVEYEKTLRYVIAELLYNTLEHGRAPYLFKESQFRMPSIIQCSWYRDRNELQFIVADLGVGIRRHLGQTYSGLSDDKSSILHALRPNVSGTFQRSDPYKGKNNAGIGLFISSNIVKSMHANMHIVSGNGLVHVSARDVTSRDIEPFFPGTFVQVEINLGKSPNLNLQRLTSEFREEAMRELSIGKKREEESKFYFHIKNYFGSFAENKMGAIKQRDLRIIPALNDGKVIELDFDGVQSSPHSFLSALLATPVKNLGLSAYKRIKILNATNEIRETIDFIFDENTA